MNRYTPPPRGQPMVYNCRGRPLCIFEVKCRGPANKTDAFNYGKNSPYKPWYALQTGIGQTTRIRDGTTAPVCNGTWICAHIDTEIKIRDGTDIHIPKGTGRYIRDGTIAPFRKGTGICAHIDTEIKIRDGTDIHIRNGTGLGSRKTAGKQPVHPPEWERYARNETIKC